MMEDIAKSIDQQLAPFSNQPELHKMKPIFPAQEEMQKAHSYSDLEQIHHR